MDDKVARCLEVIDAAIKEYNPCRILGLFSGGHDSLTACHVASRHPAFSYAIHINTGIGVPETREFVRNTSAEFGWNLHEYFALDYGQNYEEMVAQYGFPGPGQHPTMYRRLKERALRKAMREAKKEAQRNAAVLLISGVRFQESSRRMGYQAPVTKEDSKVWVNIINDWSKADCNQYLAENNIKRSPVVDKIHKSGECLCGAFAKPGEFEELKFWYPEYAKYIESLTCAKGKKWGWGAYNYVHKKKQKHQSMCSSCINENNDLLLL